MSDHDIRSAEKERLAELLDFVLDEEAEASDDRTPPADQEAEPTEGNPE